VPSDCQSEYSKAVMSMYKRANDGSPLGEGAFHGRREGDEG